MIFFSMQLLALTITWQNFQKFTLQYKVIFHKMMFTFGLRKSKYIWLETIHKRSHLSFLSHSYFSSTVQWPFSKVLSKLFSTKNRFWNSTFLRVQFKIGVTFQEKLLDSNLLVCKLQRLLTMPGPWYLYCEWYSVINSSSANV